MTKLVLLLKVCMTFSCYYVPVDHPDMAACIAQGNLEVMGKGTTWTYTCKFVPSKATSYLTAN